MKTKFLRGILSIVLILSMLMTSAMGVLAAPANDTPADDRCYTVELVDGVLKIKINPDKVNDVIEDGDITKEELLQFVPEDVLEALKKGKEVTVDELKAIVSSRITADDLRELVKMVPVSVVTQYFDTAALTEIFAVDELLSLVDVNELLAGISEDQLRDLLAGDALDVLLKPELESLVTSDIVETLVKETNFVDKILADEQLKNKIITNQLIETVYDHGYLGDVNIIHAIEMALEKGFITEQELIDNFGTDIIDISVDEVVEAEILTYEEIFEICEDNIEGFSDIEVADLLKKAIDEEYVTAAEIIDTFGTDIINIGIDEILDSGILTHEQIVDICEAYIEGFAETGPLTILEKAIAKNYVTKDEIVSAVGTKIINIDLDDIVALGLLTDEQYREIYIRDFAGVDPESITTADVLDVALEKGYITETDIYDKLDSNNVNITLDEAMGYNLLTNEELLNIYRNDLGIDVDPALVVEKALDDEYVTEDELLDLVDADNVTISLDDAIDSNLITKEELIELYEALGVAIDPAVVVRAAFDGEYVSAEDLIDLVHEGNITITFDQIVDLDIITNSELLELFGGVNAIKDMLLTNPEARHEIVELILNNPDIHIADYWPHVDIIKFVELLGGYSELASHYTPEDIKALIKAIGVDKLRTFAIENGIIEKLDVKALALDAIELVKSKKAELKALIKEVVTCFTNALFNDVDVIYLNGTPIFKNGAFNLDKLLYTYISMFTDVEKFMTLGENDIIASEIYSFDLKGEENDFEFGVEIGLLGDPANLQKTLERLCGYFDVDVDESMNVSADVVLPERVFANIYRKVLTTDRLPEDLKTLIIMMPSLCVDDAIDAIESITDEDINKLVEFFNSEKIQTALDKLDKVARGYANKIYDKFTSVDAFNAYRQKTLEKLGALPEGLRQKTVSDLYVADGTWSFNRGYSVDLYAQISKVVTLPEEIKVIFSGDFKVDGTLAATVVTRGVYEVRFAVPSAYPSEIDVPELSIFLPVGTPLSVLDPIMEAETGWSLADGTAVEAMPAGDVVLYNNDYFNFVRFINSQDNTLVEAVVYIEGAEAIAEPQVPAKEGHFARWEAYELNVENVIDVYSEYEVYPTYTVTFKVEGNTVDTVTYTYGDTELSRIPDINDGAEFFKAGYSYSWPETITLDNTSFDVDAIRTAKLFDVVFVNGETVVKRIEGCTVETVLAEGDIPAVEARPGYTGAWEAFDLSDYSKVVDGVMTINAQYTPNVYTISFYADGNLVKAVEYTFGATSVEEPAVPEKLGYTGAWGAYDLSVPGDIRVDAVYTANTYNATFVADGKVVGVVPFTVEDKTIVEPAVPEKEGFEGKWESYTLGAADITINAVYTEIEGATFWWILIVILVLAIAGLVVYLVMKKNGGDDTPTPGAEEAIEFNAIPEVEDVDADAVGEDVYAEAEADAETEAESGEAEAEESEADGSEAEAAVADEIVDQAVDAGEPEAEAEAVEATEEAATEEAAEAEAAAETVEAEEAAAEAETAEAEETVAETETAEVEEADEADAENSEAEEADEADAEDSEEEKKKN